MIGINYDPKFDTSANAQTKAKNSLFIEIKINIQAFKF